MRRNGDTANSKIKLSSKAKWRIGLCVITLLETALYIYGVNDTQRKFENTMDYLQAEYKAVENDLTYCIAYMETYGKVPTGYEELVKSIVEAVDLEEEK